MRSSPRREQDIDQIEWTALRRQFDGVIQQGRIEALGRSLETSPLAVAHFYGGFCGDRPTLTLDNGMILRLWLYGPARGVVSSLRSIDWRSDAWRVGVQFADGSPTTLAAFRAELRT